MLRAKEKTMKTLHWLVMGISSFVFCIPSGAAGQITPPLLPTRSGMVQKSPWAIHAHFVSPKNPLEVTTYRVKSNFEMANVSPTFESTYQLDIRAVIPKYRLLASSGRKSDLFYCEQAIWDSAPFLEPFINSHGKISFSSKEDNSSHFACGRTYFKAHPKLRGKVVVIHVIPPAGNDFFPDAVLKDEIHKMSNLRGVPIGKLDSSLLQNFREDWAEYIRSKTRVQVTREEILEHGNEVLKRYSALFVD